MPVKPEFNPEFLYFVTTVAVAHTHLFERDVIKRILVDSLHYLRTSGRMRLFAFVIMPNHIHLVAKFSKEYPLSDVMRDFKKFTGRQIYRQFQAENEVEMLVFLRRARGKRDQAYKIWEKGFDARDVFSIKFLEQKIDYIHHNPCQPRWNLVQVPEAYVWSTAAYYLSNKPGVIPVDDIREYLHN